MSTSSQNPFASSGSQPARTDRQPASMTASQPARTDRQTARQPDSQPEQTDRQPEQTDSQPDSQPGLKSKFQESAPLPKTSIPYTTGKKNLHFSANFRSEAFCRLWQPARQTDKQPTRQTNSQPARTDWTDRQLDSQTASQNRQTDSQNRQTASQPDSQPGLRSKFQESGPCLPVCQFSRNIGIH